MSTRIQPSTNFTDMLADNNMGLIWTKPFNSETSTVSKISAGLNSQTLF